MSEIFDFSTYVPAIVSASAAAAAGLGLVWRSRTHRASDGEQAADLLARKEALYAQLRELDDTRDRLDGPLYAKERERLIGDATAVLAELDRARETEPAAPEIPAPLPDKSTFSGRYPQLTGALWGAAVVGFGFLLYSGIEKYSGKRVEGQSITGGSAMDAPETPPGEGEFPPEAQAELAAFASAVTANPADVEAKNRYGHALISVNKVLDAWKLAEEVVATDPDNPEARVHQAVSLLEIGDLPMAAKLLDKVLAGHPDQAEALGYRGAIYIQMGERDNAIQAWTKGKSADPSQAELFDDLIGRVDSLLAGSANRPPGTQTNPTAAPESAVGPVEFSGQITVSEGSTAPAGTLFVYVRAQGVDRGPPLRVKKLSPSFPALFELTAADSPMGGVVSGTVEITAKLDQDGNPTTAEPGNLSGKSVAVEVGAHGVSILLAPI